MPKPFVCNIAECGKRFSLRHHLHRHERTHGESHPFACAEEGCSSKFTRKEQLRRHQQNVHASPTERRSKVYICGAEGCEMTFDKWSLAVKHRKNEHQNTLSISCVECGKNFAKPRYLKLHIDRVHAQVMSKKRFPCEWPECGRVFSSRNAVKVHVATVHEKSKPYSCEHCGRTFGHRHLVARHRRSHQVVQAENETDVREDVKDSDNYSPTQKTPLVDRLLGLPYESSRQHECPLIGCRMRFFRSYDLQRHMDSSHPIDLPEFVEAASIPSISINAHSVQ